jgi:outer membrane protein assembly factor BamD
VGRLTLQTLINTYPDSEYLAKAKLAIADSYYSEGGVSGLTQAEAEYKDFITFFPTAPEAPEAQFRAGMAHFRLMAKADRDRTEAKLAEVEFKDFLLKYPDSPLIVRVKARLRETQEVLAQGDYKIARYYYLKGATPAARSRFQEIVERYPDFSDVDSSLWYLGQSLERLKRPQEAVPFYSRILTEHPLSPLADDAKQRLVAMHRPIPRPTRAILARARADALKRPQRGLFDKLGGAMSGSPDTSATRHGPAHLGPSQPAEAEMAKGAAGAAAPGNTIVAQPVNDISLDPEKPADPKPGPAGNSTAGEPSSKPDPQKSSAAANPSDSPEAPPPAKKKGRLHFLKKLVPF